MGRLLLRLCALFSALGLSACGPDLMAQLQVGISTASEIRRLLGEPGMEWRHADGSVTWEYSRQPEGMSCHMLTLGPDQVLKKIEQVITPRNLAKIGPGMDQDDVRRLLGKPRSVQVFQRKGEEVWDWKTGREFATEEYFNVHFDLHGQVLSTSTSRSQN